MRNGRWLLLGAALCLTAGQAQAQPPVICVEDAVFGCVGTVLTSAPPILVGSDGDGAPFLPFNLPPNLQTVSDAILFPTPTWAYIGPPGWVNLPGTATWYLPEPPGLPDPLFEPIGHWVLAGGAWDPATPLVQVIVKPTGEISDIIRLFNDANGANLTFQSGIVPEPATVGLLITGLAAVGVVRRVRRKA